MVQLVHRILSLQLTVVENKTFKVNTLIKSATHFTNERSCKKKHLVCKHSLSRVFILNSIASETGHFLEMVELVNRTLSLQLTDVENKTFKVKTLIKSATYFTHERSCKKKHLICKHSLSRVFILNSIASETGHSLEMVRSLHRILSLQLTVFETRHSR